MSYAAKHRSRLVAREELIGMRELVVSPDTWTTVGATAGSFWVDTNSA